MDRIYIRNLTCQCILGVNAEERNKLQKIIVNIIIYHEPVLTDNIEFTVDYDSVSQKVLSTVFKTQFQLIETLAQYIANLVLEIPKVSACRVTVEKPGVPLGAERAGAEVLRIKKSGNS